MRRNRNPFQIDTSMTRPEKRKQLDWEESALDSHSSVEDLYDDQRSIPSLSESFLIFFGYGTHFQVVTDICELLPNLLNVFTFQPHSFAQCCNIIILQLLNLLESLSVYMIYLPNSLDNFHLNLFKWICRLLRLSL